MTGDYNISSVTNFEIFLEDDEIIEFIMKRLDKKSLKILRNVAEELIEKRYKMTEEEISNLLKSKIETKDLTKEEIITYLKKDVLQKTCDSLTQLGILGLVSIIAFENVAQYQDIVVNLVAETINRFGEDLVAMLKETIQ